LETFPGRIRRFSYCHLIFQDFMESESISAASPCPWWLQSTICFSGITKPARNYKMNWFFAPVHFSMRSLRTFVLDFASSPSGLTTFSYILHNPFHLLTFLTCHGNLRSSFTPLSRECRPPAHEYVCPCGFVSFFSP